MIADSRIEDFLSRFPDKKKTSNGWQAKCPAHDDHKASLCIHIADDGVIGLKCQALCETENVVKKVGFEMKDLFPGKPPTQKNSFGKIVAEYPYLDESGKLLYQGVRFEPKDFRQRQPAENGGWVWNLKGVRLVPYRLPELLVSTETVFIVEGEKDVENLRKIGFTATCNPMGAGKWRKEFNQYFINRDVIVIPDKDEPGRKHALDVAKNLDGVAHAVKILEMPGDAKDFSAWLEVGGTRDALFKLLPGAIDAKAYLPFSFTMPSMEKVGKIFSPPASFKILGYTKGFDILLWQNGHLSIIKTAQMNPAFLRLLAGPLESEEIADLKKWIPEEAHIAGLIDDVNRVTTGIQRLKDGRWLIVSGKKAAVINKAGLQFIHKPVIDGRIIEFSGDSWLDWDSLESALNDPIENILADILALVRQWRWSDPEMPYWATTFLMLSPFQSAMSWRPSLFVNGAQGCGKSLFFELIESIFGSLTAKVDKTTAHALAQSVGNSGKIPLLDEFERYRHVGSILDLLKIGNRGGFKTSGTPGQSCLEYRINHLFWMAGVYLPAEMAQDAAKRSRAVIFELTKTESSNPPKMPSMAEGKKLAARIAGAMIGHWEKIESGATSLNSNKEAFIKEGVSDRTVENFSYAGSILGLAGLSMEIPSWGAVDVKDDGCLILESILSSLTKDNHLIGRLIDDVKVKNDDKAERTLEDNGLKLVSKDGRFYLAIKSDIVSRYLLKDTPCKDLDISGPLGRFAGAIKNHSVKFGKEVRKCVLIPFSGLPGYQSYQEVTKDASETLNNTILLEEVTLVTKVTTTPENIPSTEKGRNFEKFLPKTDILKNLKKPGYQGYQSYHGSSG